MEDPIPYERIELLSGFFRALRVVHSEILCFKLEHRVYVAEVYLSACAVFHRLLARFLPSNGIVAVLGLIALL